MNQRKERAKENEKCRFFSTYGPAALTSQTQTATWAIPCHWLCNSSGQNSKGNVEHQKTKKKEKKRKKNQ
jgi:hypothetical protein